MLLNLQPLCPHSHPASPHTNQTPLRSLTPRSEEDEADLDKAMMELESELGLAARPRHAASTSASKPFSSQRAAAEVPGDATASPTYLQVSVFEQQQVREENNRRGEDGSCCQISRSKP